MTERKPSLLSIARVLLLGVVATAASFSLAGTASAEQGAPTISQVDLELEGAPLTQVAPAETVLGDDTGVKIVSATIVDNGRKKVAETDGAIPIGSTIAVSEQRGYERLFSAPLQVNDYILLVETNGDATITLTGLDEFGLPRAGSEKSLQSFQWDTGIEAADGETYWVSVIAADSLAGSQGIRTQSDAADVQILPLKVIADEEILSDETRKAREQAGEEKKEAESKEPVALVGEIAFNASATTQKSSDSCAGEDVLSIESQTEVAFCYLVTNTGSSPLTDVRFSDENLNLLDVYLPRVTGNDLLFPGESAVYTTTLTSSEVSTIFTPRVSAAVADEQGSIQENVAKAVSDDAVQLEIAGSGLLGETTVAGSVQDGQQLDEVLPKEPVTEAEASPTGAATDEIPEVEAPTALAFTGIETTIILLVLAAGALFFGNTVRLAAAKEKDILT